MSQSREPVEVAIVSVFIPWPEVAYLVLQIAIIQVVISGVALVGLRLFGVI